MVIITKLFEKKRYRSLVKIQDAFLVSYSNRDKSISEEEWLAQELISYLPESDPTELVEDAKEIVRTLKLSEQKKKEACEKYQQGQSIENIIGKDIKNSIAYETNKSLSDNLEEIGRVLEKNSEEMKQTLLTQSGQINKNPNLNGYIAEQAHANTFNRNAALNGSGARAEVLKPNSGQKYGKNSVDIVVKTSDGKQQRYQLKYGKTSKETIEMIKKGDYRNQRIIVPPEQVEDVQKAFPNKTVSDKISCDGVKSDSMSKSDATTAQEKAQEKGDFLGEDWNDLSTGQLAKNIGKYATKSAIVGAISTTALEVGIKVVKDEDIEAEEIAKKAIIAGADTGVKTATAGAIKVCAEKGILSGLKGASGNVIAGIAFGAVENAKIMYKVGQGDLTIKEGLNEMEMSTAGVVGGIAGTAKGASVGAAIGTALGPVGTAVGGVVGGVLGGIAGSAVGKGIAKGTQKIRRAIGKRINKAKDAVKDIASSLLGIFA